MKSKAEGLLAGLLLLVSSAALSYAGPSPAAPGKAPWIAPAFAEKDSNNKSVALKNYLGRVVMLNFWATWCPPCKVEIPALESLQKTYMGKLQIIGAAVFSTEADVREFYSSQAINYPVIRGSYDLMEKYGKISAVPTTILIDKKGEIVASVVGSRTAAQYEELLKPLFAE